MSKHLTDEVRLSLREAADEVEVPAIDQLRFDDVVHGVRRRRARRRASLLGGGLAAAAATVVGLLVTGSFSSQDSAPPATEPDSVVVPNAAEPAVLVSDGAVMFVGGAMDIVTLETAVGSIKDAYRTVDGAVLLDESGTLSRFSVDPGRRTGSVDPLGADVDSVQVSVDGNVVAWIEDGPDGPIFRQFWPVSGLLSSVEAPAAGRILAVRGARALVAIGPDLWIWRTTGAASGDPELTQSLDPLISADGISVEEFSVDGTWSGDFVSLPRADRTGTDIVRVDGASMERLGAVPLAQGTISPSGDRVVGFTQDAVDAGSRGTADAIEVWSLRGVLATGFSELPGRVDQVAWLDNDTLGITGGEAGERGPIDYYICVVSTATCAEQQSDPTGPDDELPLLASGHGLAR